MEEEVQVLVLVAESAGGECQLAPNDRFFSRIA